MSRTTPRTTEPSPDASERNASASGGADPADSADVAARVAEAAREIAASTAAGTSIGDDSSDVESDASGAHFWFQRRAGEEPADCDRRWRDEVYRGDVPQLTARAVLTGMALGAVLALSNLYVGLKAGWAMGVAITACVVSTAAWRGIHGAGLTRQPMRLLEQNCMQGTASAAGFASVSILVTAVPAYMLMTGLRIGAPWLVLWTFFVSLLGLALAVPVKRHLVQYESLPWPSSLAAAQTLRSLHEHGQRAVLQSRRLFASAAAAAALRWSIDNRFGWWPLPHWPETFAMPGRLAGQPAAAYTLGLDGSTLYLAAGALLGLRIATWLLVGSTLAFAVVGPLLHASGRLEQVGYAPILLSFSLWTGAALMVTSSLTGLALQWRVIARGLVGLGSMVRRREAEREDALAAIEVPASWALVAGATAAIGIVVVGEWALGIAWPLGMAGVAMAVVAVVVASRAAGETDITPVGSLGKVGQIGYGVMAPTAVAANLLGTSILSTAAASGADLLTNLKCGHLLGAQPRRQFVAQLLGVLAGTLVVVPAFLVLVPSPDVIGSEALPAPAAQSWRVVADLAASGFGVLGPEARVGLAVGAVLGILFTLLESSRPRWRRWIPSATALGMGLVIPFNLSASFFVGAVIATVLQRRRPRASEDLVVPVSSGLIAGESLMGVLLAVFIALGLMAS